MDPFDKLLNWDTKRMIFEYCIPEEVFDHRCHTPGLLVRTIMPILAVNKAFRQSMCVVLNLGRREIVFRLDGCSTGTVGKSLLEQAAELNVDIKRQVKSIARRRLGNRLVSWYYKPMLPLHEAPRKMKRPLRADLDKLTILRDLVRQGAQGEMYDWGNHSFNCLHKEDRYDTKRSATQFEALRRDLNKLDKYALVMKRKNFKSPSTLSRIFPSWAWQDRDLNLWIWETNHGSWQFGLNYDELIDPHPDMLDVVLAMQQTYFLVLSTGARITEVKYCSRTHYLYPFLCASSWTADLVPGCDCEQEDCICSSSNPRYQVWTADLGEFI